VGKCISAKRSSLVPFCALLSRRLHRLPNREVNNTGLLDGIWSRMDNKLDYYPVALKGLTSLLIVSIGRRSCVVALLKLYKSMQSSVRQG
jgi:hypothetical protein